VLSAVAEAESKQCTEPLQCPLSGPSLGLGVR